EAVFQYKCDAFYAPSSEAGIAWDDPALGIDWGIPAGDIILSAKDKNNPRLSELTGRDDILFNYSDDLY
ncbi:MAG: dTDP-4-dehydrorhamnose 3,5-epimerase family protein, partial [Bacteroidales bacterium]|nr:dTDP-4-dehydrorhamnose 3,5-epimerase family protein [Bacteroidales bacterium]